MIENLVSIIVPVYNVEAYLDICIDSIVRQTYRNIEIILIDDGSTDRSGELCDIWRERDKRIRVIHKKNDGLSAARNTGLEIARGAWILFIDSDDYVQLELVRRCYEVVKKYEADVVFFNYEKVEETCINKILNKKSIMVKEYSGKEMLTEFIRNEKGSVVACNKMYHRKIWDTLRFPEGKIHEDEYVIIDVWQQVKKAVQIDEVLYYYRQRADSITHSESLKSRYDALEALELRCEKLRENQELYYRALGKYLNWLVELCILEPKKQKRKNLIRQFQMNWNWKSAKYLKRKGKVRLIIFNISPRSCLFLMKCNRMWKRRKSIEDYENDYVSIWN